MPLDEDEISTNIVRLGPVLKLRRLDIAVVEGPDRGARLRVDQGRARVGTAAGNELRLTDRTVSRVHCAVEMRRDRVRLIDCGSTNGTFVHGLAVHHVELTAPADAKLGGSVLRIEIGPEPVIMPLSARDRFGLLVGGTAEMRRIYYMLERLAPTDTTVLIQGETGTGKELVARSLHDASARAAGPFVAVDCGGIAASLIESELFGHVRGAFSGASSDRRGLLEAANGGTVFLDEIGELPVELQPKLLRALEAREVRPVGANAPRNIDVRVVCATNRPLSEAVNRGSFREDLYYRIAVVELELPPLRLRRDDIAMLVAHVYQRLTGSVEPPPADLVAAARARAWPGNVRELRNFVERSLRLGWSNRAEQQAPTGVGTRAEARIDARLPLRDARVAWVAQFEALYLSALLEQTDGNVTRAAELAGVNRRSLQRLMARVGLRSEDADSDAPRE